MGLLARGAAGAAAIAAAGLVALYFVPEEEAQLASAAWFEGKVGPFGEDGGFADFLREQAGETVELDVTLESRQFSGAADRLVLFEECDVENAKPDRRWCGGSEYRVRGAAIRREGPLWRLRGRFQVRELPPDGRWRIYELLAK
ncbi:MAG: hypothetical protein K2X35_17025 [Bryobacteraceae bacterium]|nr:hypothetical protein [Bryobacteraceae bacterium]